MKKLIPFEGKMVNAELIPFKPGVENWNQYELADGTIIRIRLCLTGVMRIVGHQNDRGEPLYHFATVTEQAVFVPDELCQGGGTKELN